MIRPERETDVEAVLDVLETVAGEGRWIGMELPIDRTERGDRIRAGLVRPQTYAGFVAEVDAKVIGSIGLDLAPYGVADLGISLLEAYRGQGIGMSLMRRGIDWARDAGAHKVGLQVWPHNQRGIALYTKLGFVEEGRLRQHYRRRNGERWDAVIMGLLLEPLAGLPTPPDPTAEGPPA